MTLSIFMETMNGRRWLTGFRRGEPFYSFNEARAYRYQTTAAALKAKRRAIRWMGVNHYDSINHK